MRTQFYNMDRAASDLKQVLLVEDSEDDAFFFERTLEKIELPCCLAHAIHGGEAIDYLQVARNTESPERMMPDVIFLDLKMPVLNGFEVLKWIGEQHFRPALHVAILSGSDQQSDIQMARELGATDYLVKPISVQDLAKRLLALPKRHLAFVREADDARVLNGAPS